jgi:hypothetical protein
MGTWGNSGASRCGFRADEAERYSTVAFEQATVHQNSCLGNMAASVKHTTRNHHRGNTSPALRQRGSLTVWFTNAAIAAWKAELRTRRGGQPRYSALAFATALTLISVFRLALRQTEGLIASIIALLGLDLAVPDHTTLTRRAESLDVVRLRPGPGPVHLLVESTGLKLCGSGRGRMTWQKAACYNWRALVEADISRFKRVIGDGLRSRTDRRRATEVAIAVTH